MTRGDDLRALVSVGEPIALGYCVAVAVGLLVYVQRFLPSNKARFAVFAVLITGLITPLSRGPWVGAAVMILIVLLTSAAPFKRILKFGLVGAVIVPFAFLTPFGEKLVDYLPFVGTSETATISYRERLLDISIGVIQQNPLFGGFDFMYSPDMQELVENHMIDIVNSYLGVALSSGLVGLFLFSGILIAALFAILKTMWKASDKASEQYVLGQAFVSTLVGIMVIIFTVSSVTVIPVIYWAIAGLGVAYSSMQHAGQAAVPAVSPNLSRAHLSGV
jgi:O-antigen ligase